MLGLNLHAWVPLFYPKVLLGIRRWVVRWTSPLPPIFQVWNVEKGVGVTPFPSPSQSPPFPRPSKRWLTDPLLARDNRFEWWETSNLCVLWCRWVETSSLYLSTMVDSPSQIPRGKARFESEFVELRVNTNMLWSMVSIAVTVYWWRYLPFMTL